MCQTCKGLEGVGEKGKAKIGEREMSRERVGRWRKMKEIEKHKKRDRHRWGE